MIYLYILIIILALTSLLFYKRSYNVITNYNILVDDYNKLKKVSKELLNQNDDLRKVIDIDLVKRCAKLQEEASAWKNAYVVMKALRKEEK